MYMSTDAVGYVMFTLFEIIHISSHKEVNVPSSLYCAQMYTDADMVGRLGAAMYNLQII